MHLSIHPYARTYSVKGVGIATVVVLGIAMAGVVAVTVSPLAARGLARRALVNDDVDLLNQAQLLDGLLVLPYLGATVVAAVMVITWLYRARKNLDAFPEANPSMGAGWAIGGWFIPLANLVIPGRVMASVVRDSLPSPGRAVALVWTWWVGWIIGNLVDAGFTRADQAKWEALPSEISGPEDYQAYVDYYGDEVARGVPGTVLTVLAGLLLCILIMRVSRAQHDRIAAAMPPPVMPGMVIAQPGHPAQPGYPAGSPPAPPPQASSGPGYGRTGA